MAKHDFFTALFEGVSGNIDTIMNPADKARQLDLASGYLELLAKAKRAIKNSPTMEWSFEFPEDTSKRAVARVLRDLKKHGWAVVVEPSGYRKLMKGWSR